MSISWRHNFLYYSTADWHSGQSYNYSKWYGFQQRCYIVLLQLVSKMIFRSDHYGSIIMGAIASQITSLTIVYSTVYSDADQRKHQSSASLTFVWENHRGPVNSPDKWPETWKFFHLMTSSCVCCGWLSGLLHQHRYYQSFLDNSSVM